MYYKTIGYIGQSATALKVRIFSKNDIQHADISAVKKRKISALYWAGARIATDGASVFWLNYPISPLATLAAPSTFSAEAKEAAITAAKAIQPSKKWNYNPF